VEIEFEDVGVVDEDAEDPLLLVAVRIVALVQAFGNDLENNNRSWRQYQKAGQFFMLISFIFILKTVKLIGIKSS
jgi:hypothetical protein